MPTAGHAVFVNNSPLSVAMAYRSASRSPLPNVTGIVGVLCRSAVLLFVLLHLAIAGCNPATQRHNPRNRLRPRVLGSADRRLNLIQSSQF
ncbi:hypothetical protein A5652_00190 [Mycobacterium sp. 1165178.9]|nr:hypothetical protein A5652_00190 [Mycobacterium sp. 1165178.9]